ncbi:uncharacterized protein [Ptychodera flava]|uniref:uncharacterized protein n=1 Tax=Ptychodera flava TaxID=63121 RepID=UPI003969D915
MADVVQVENMGSLCLHNAIWLLDMHIYKCRAVILENIQAIGTAALFVASKHEIGSADVDQLCWYTARDATREMVLMLERIILINTQFSLNVSVLEMVESCQQYHKWEKKQKSNEVPCRCKSVLFEIKKEIFTARYCE